MSDDQVNEGEVPHPGQSKYLLVISLAECPPNQPHLEFCGCPRATLPAR